MGADLSEADIRKTTEIVLRLSDEVKERSQTLVRNASRQLSGVRPVPEDSP
jgi:hypothetical protein